MAKTTIEWTEKPFRMPANNLPALRDLQPGTLFYFNNVKIFQGLCEKTGIAHPLKSGIENPLFGGCGWRPAGCFGIWGGWYLANARVIPVMFNLPDIDEEIKEVI